MPHKSTTTTDFCIRKSRSKSKRFGIFFVIATLLLSPLGMIFGVPTQPANANPIIAADPSTIAACGGNPECFAFSIDTRLDATGGLTNVSNAAFILPTAGLTGGGTIAKAYNWIVNWGDGIGDQNYSGSSNYIGGGINYTYANPGQYQITIRPAATAAMNWMGGFGFYSSDSTGSNAPTNRQQILSIDTPFTNLMRTKGAASRFASVFSGAVNAVGIPDNLFANISTTGDTNFANMFDYAFSDFAYNSTTATIPAGLFDSIDTSSGTNISYMFRNTFQRSAYNSTVATIPAGLFDFFDTSLATSITYLFYNTFSYYAYNSTIATIPPGLFNSITTSQVTTSFVYVFASTFAYYAYSSPIANIPANLFASVDTSRGTNLGNMFNGTFTYFAFSSPNASIPAGLFDSINTSQTTSFSSTFNSTFAYYANSSTVGIIPTDLFDSIDTSVGSNFANTFNNTFSNYARRTASFVVNGTVVQTQTFANTYSTKNTSTDNLPATNPTVNAGNVVVPTYNSTSRNITRPGGAYLDFDWYRTDGTSCAVASPTPNCGPQTTPVTFTNTTEWIPTTSTEWGSVNFYALLPNGTTQIEYAIYNNADSLTPGSQRAADNTPATVGAIGTVGADFRVRTGLLNETLANLTGAFTLQFGENVTTCTDITAWADVTNTTAIAYNTNPSATSGAAITATPAPAPPFGVSWAPQRYVSNAADFSTIATIPDNGAGLWDFSLINYSASAGDYCLRIVNDDGTLLNQYDQYPEITVSPTEQYVTLDISGTTGINVDPGRMSSNSNDIIVSTNAIRGYNLTLSTDSTDDGLAHTINPTWSIPAVNGTPLIPGSLGDGTSAWGFRVDGLGGFGSGTTVETNVASSAFTWAAVPISTSPLQIRSRPATDLSNIGGSNTPDTTRIFFGAAVSTSQLAGSYQADVLFTVTASL